MFKNSTASQTLYFLTLYIYSNIFIIHCIPLIDAKYTIYKTELVQSVDGRLFISK
jgi:hypothetical protein